MTLTAQTNPEGLSPSDWQTIRKQRGREPLGAREVMRRCPAGHPLVIRVASVVRGQPFPTLYWLTCPAVKKQIDQLEAAGGVAALQRRVAGDKPLAAAFAQLQDNYAAARELFMSDDEKTALQKLGAADHFRKIGVGGVQNKHQVRCLHMHLAFHLVTPSPIGRLIEEASGLQLCLTENDQCP